ncbi:MAG: transketolase [Lachnospiraceae bacterium]|nr:transketolase [Lachnospiraceae bacterium]
MNTTNKALALFACQIRLAALECMKHLGFGHVGGSMSIAETLAVLYGKQMNINPKEPQWKERDWLVMSKGHCGPALYAALALKGYFPKSELETMNTGGTSLPSHCDRNKTTGIDMSTGSLGQGISTAIGTAMGHKLQGQSNYTYLILGDGECDEGQIWEGALFAAQHKVHNLIAFVDYNKQQLDGYTKDVCNLGDLKQKFEDFGWHAQEVDGHSIEQIDAAIESAKAENEKPSAIILHTIKGRGCSFAEGQLYNHHMNFSTQQYEDAHSRLLEQIKAFDA